MDFVVVVEQVIALGVTRAPRGLAHPRSVYDAADTQRAA
jgi:hypothetical protein